MRYVKNNVIDENIDESEILIYDPIKDEFHILNETASEIYASLCNGHSLNEVINQYIESHGSELQRDEAMITEKELIFDVRNTIEKLLDAGIIKVEETSNE